VAFSVPENGHISFVNDNTTIMAKLIKDKAIVEINFVDYPYGCVRYNLRFLYGDKPLINPELLVEDPFSFDEYEKDSLIPFLKRLLKDDANDVWQSLEPEMRIEAVFSPKMGLKEVENDPSVIYISDDQRERYRRVDEERKKAGGKLPEDNFIFRFFVQEAKLKPFHESGESGYGEFVPAMQLWVSRKELEDFVVQLKQDYEEWKVRNKEQIAYCWGEVNL